MALTLRELRGRLPGAPSQLVLARRARVSAATVCRAESGRDGLDFATETALASAYAITVEQLRRARDAARRADRT